MNEKLYAVCAQISDEDRKRDRKAFFRSIHGTLNHLPLTDRGWLGRFNGKPWAFPGEPQLRIAEINAFLAKYVSKGPDGSTGPRD